MALGGYDAFDDPYSYKNSEVLKNRLGIRQAPMLEAFELEMTSIRAQEPLPAGRYGVHHYRQVHRHLFQDVYRWAGKYRTIRTGKAGNWFCYPEHISREMDRLFGILGGGQHLLVDDLNVYLARAAEFLGELNAIHPFREGNGRSQLAFMDMLGRRVGRPFDLTRVRSETFLPAMIASFHGQLDPLTNELGLLLQD